MRRAVILLGLCFGTAQAGSLLPAHEASVWLQGMAEASNRHAYQGIFVMQHGDRMQTLQVSNRLSPNGKQSRLVGMDGEQREVHCTREASVSIVGGASPKLERRIGGRHFPDLLPADAGRLAAWYDVRLGEVERVAGLDCQSLTLEPKDQYRWGHIICADLDTKLPLKAVLIDQRGRPLMQYSFAEVRIARQAPADATSRPWAEAGSKAALDAPKAITSGAVEVRHLPPGFSRVVAVKRPLAKQPAEVEHWVFSDGLTHISLFVEPLAAGKNVSLRGASQRGMTNLRTLRVGQNQVTVVGDAPQATVELITRAIAERQR
jgi:sigma-E factor negative regulatory protein RseB